MIKSKMRMPVLPVLVAANILLLLFFFLLIKSSLPSFQLSTILAGFFLSIGWAIYVTWEIVNINKGYWKASVAGAKFRRFPTGSMVGAIVFVCTWSFLLVFFLGNHGFLKHNNKRDIDSYFEGIRGNESLLTEFFSGMPKGGDLHHHYSGSVYAETYWDAAVKYDFWIDTVSLAIDKPKAQHWGSWRKCSDFASYNRLAAIRQRMLQNWSVKDYFDALEPSDKHFFEAFGRFSKAADTCVIEGFLEIKDRAKKEHVVYIETMYSGVDAAIKLNAADNWNSKLIGYQKTGDRMDIQKALDTLYHMYIGKDALSAVATYCTKLDKLHYGLKIDDSLFTMRYLTSANRNLKPVDFFKSALLAFDAASRDTLIVGVNILSQEDKEISMRDYGFHMEVFRFCHRLYPDVKYSMHAGELTPSLVKPELLSSHISQAVLRAGANRIGHGVDIARESDCSQLLEYMAEKKIPVEINLVSNEFILKVKDDQHPVLLYHRYGVPITISTDDAGILRTDLTAQFVLLAKRYPSFKYRDIKTFIRNSISFSFLDEKLKKMLSDKLDMDLARFEDGILRRGNVF